MRKYLPQDFESKWMQQWQEQQLYAMPSLDEIQTSEKKPFYSLYSFPYPSGAGLHVGHVEGMVANDIVARYERMRGNSAVLPMGWDSFGLPAENYAIKTGIHPQDSTDAVIETFREQINRIGISVDWGTEVGAHWPSYYRWTQWIFLQLYKHGLAYQKEAPVNWCPHCQTTLANEQVVDGVCERCDTEVERRTMKQWFFRITAFAEELYHDLDQVDWPASTIEQQRNWIGRSVGAEIRFSLAGSASESAKDADGGQHLTVFTTRPDTLYGVTYMVIAPEHPMVASLTTDTQKNAVEEYAVQAAAKTDIQRTSLEKDKTGVFTGSYAVHPLTGKQIPIWVADYVLIGYGTGVVMAVPAHDERDFAFAKTYDLPIVAVVRPTEQTDDAPSNATTEESSAQKLPFVENGISINSPLINDLPTQQAKEAIIAHLESQQIGKRSITYRLRDWLVSRQRYWGAPIPIVYDPDGQPHPVAEDDLPVTLPYEVDFKPTGQSPLTYTDEFHQSAEQRYGAGWRREVDTMDTFVDSSWYFFRHLDADNDTSVFDTAKANAWLPTDLYMIGAEHIVLHLLYARFFTKFFHKIGLIEFREPFARMRHMGTILGPDGRKMSKRWGNVINPTDVINEFGADTVRVYEMFMGPLDQAKPWNPSNVQGSYRFLQRVWKIYQQADQYIVDEADASEPASGEKAGASDHAERGSEQAAADTAVTKKLYKTIQKVSHDIPEMKFNTAIAAMMEFLNEWEKKTNGTPPKLSRNDAASFLIILAPFAPFMTEELWHQVLGKTESIHTADWPEIADDAIVEDAINLPVQINGKTRGTVTIAPDATQEQTMEVVRQDAKLAKYLTDQPRKVIFVPGKILNVVV